MDEIVAVDGVDMVMIGTNDLMADLGIPASSTTEGARRL
jgi:2-keto-3-deoxy-L-rhamnonate aldolase RhmA